jgi:excisionase family DNA binding protein
MRGVKPDAMTRPVPGDAGVWDRVAASGGLWSVDEVARLLDVSGEQVTLWCRSGALLSRLRDGRTVVDRRGLFLFLEGQVECLLSPERVADLLDVETRTVREWLSRGRLRSVKLGEGRKAPRRVPAGELRRWIEALSGKEVAA